MKEKFGALLATGSVLAAGCQAQEATPVEPPKPTVISAEGFPAELPKPVADQLQHVVSIIGIRAPIKVEKDSKPQVMACTGVRIDEHDFLSAAQCDWDLANLDQIPYCDTMGISVQTPVADKRRGVSFSISRKAGDQAQADGTRAKNVTDNALVVEIDPKNADGLAKYTNPTRFSLSPSSIEGGNPLFIANFQMTADSRPRNPHHAFLKEEQVKNGLDKPAIMGGVALNYLSDNTIRVLTGIKSYSTPAETEPRAGAGGSPVYDETGGLVGFVVGETEQLVSQYEKDFFIDLPNRKDTDIAKTAIIQLVDPLHIRALQAKQTGLQNC
jgi:hypothetical protein